MLLNDMANVAEAENISGSSVGGIRNDQYVRSNGTNSNAGGHRCKKCGTFLRPATVTMMIAVVWGLIIVSVTSPFFPRGHGYEVRASTAD